MINKLLEIIFKPKQKRKKIIYKFDYKDKKTTNNKSNNSDICSNNNKDDWRI